VNVERTSFSIQTRAFRQGPTEFPVSARCWPTRVAQYVFSRRGFLRRATWAMAGVALGTLRASPASASDPAELADETLAFIRRCAREDGGYAPSPDPQYQGNSDTGLSDLAVVTYAAVLAKTMGWRLPHEDKSIQFIHFHQQKDGPFANLAGRMDSRSNLAVLYNTVQGVVALRALVQAPKNDPAPVMDRFFVNEAFKKLPWYTTSFFPLFYLPG
jgi:hypothetical protein